MPAEPVEGFAIDPVTAPCSLTTSLPGLAGVPMMSSPWTGAATGRLIATSADDTLKERTDEVLALIAIVSAAMETEPAGMKNGAVLPGPATARTGEFNVTVEGVRVRSKIIDCVTSWPGETVNESGATSSGSPV